jgi:hypothetical protein
VRRLFPLAALLAVLTPATARAVEVSASVSPSEVAVGQTATYTISVSGASGDVRPQPPDLPDFDVSGSGTSQSITIDNGRMTRRTDYNYYLVPRKEGAFTLPPATVTAGGKTYRTGPVRVTVVAATARSRPAPGPAPGLPQLPGMPDLRSLFGGQSRPLGAGDVRVHLSADREDPYVGEQVILTFRFERSVNLMGPADYTDPPTPGFRSFPVEMPPGADRHAEVRDGRSWAIQERRTLLFPLSAGDKTVGPAAVEFAVDPFAGRQRVVTDAVTLHVKPLPEAGRPADFSGGVGTFRLEAALDRRDATVGDTVTLTVTVSGQGNFHDLGAVHAPDAPGFEVFDPEVTDDLHNGPAGTAGARRYTFVLIPREAGDLQVGTARLSTFDPGKGAYETAEAGPFPLTVAAAAPASAPAPQAVPGRGSGGAVSRTEALAWAALVFVAGMVLLVLRRLAGRKGRVDAPELEEAPAAPGPNGAKARADLEAVLDPTRSRAPYPAHPADGWAAELDRALRNWLGARWDIPPPRVDEAAAARHLADDPEAAGACQGVLATLQAARFAPASDLDREALAAKIRALVERVDGAAPAVRK